MQWKRTVKEDDHTSNLDKLLKRFWLLYGHQMIATSKHPRRQTIGKQIVHRPILCLR